MNNQIEKGSGSFYKVSSCQMNICIREESKFPLWLRQLALRAGGWKGGVRWSGWSEKHWETGAQQSEDWSDALPRNSGLIATCGRQCIDNTPGIGPSPHPHLSITLTPSSDQVPSLVSSPGGVRNIYIEECLALPPAPPTPGSREAGRQHNMLGNLIIVTSTWFIVVPWNNLQMSPRKILTTKTMWSNHQYPPARNFTQNIRILFSFWTNMNNEQYYFW